METLNTKNPSGVAAPTAGTPEAQLHFLDYWRVIRIRKTVIFAVFLLVVITTTVVTYWLPKYYASTVRIEVEKESAEPGLFDFRANATMYDPYFIQTEYEKILSSRVLYQVITNKAFRLNEEWARRYGLKALDVPETYAILKKRIDVRQYRNTSLIEIRVLSEEPAEAQRLANEIAEAYKNERRAERVLDMSEGIKTLKLRLADQEKRVEAAAAKVTEIRDKYNIMDAGGESPQTAMLETETIRRLESTRIDNFYEFQRMSATLENLQKLKREDPAKLRNVMPTVWPDQLLTDLLQKYSIAQQEISTVTNDYGTNHPNVLRIKNVMAEVNDQIDTKVAGMMEGIEQRVATLKAGLASITASLDAVKTNDLSRGLAYSMYATAKRELEFERQIRQTMAMKIVQEEVDMERSGRSVVHVTDRAELGLRPVRPNVPLNIAMGVVVGLIVGIGLAFFIEYLDTSVKTIDDVERALGAPVLGVIPQNVGALLAEGPESPHAEAYRVLRTNLMFSRKNEQFNTVTVVSGGAGEGKSTTVINLATIFAQNGQRVLVVDSDLRRPSLHKFLKISNAVGLTNYLLKQKTLEEVIQTTALTSLDFLPSGKLPSSSMGILNSARMREFIKEVRLRYDMVFFDSPPIMGVSDASILASEVDMTLLVVQYRKYPQLMTLRAKQMVEKVGGHMMGVVLNNINISQDSYYYYYSGYYYDYYSKRDEDGDAKAEAKDAKRPVGDLAKVESKEK